MILSSSPRVNYAARPSKSIQRELVFGALRSAFLPSVDPLVYVGFGAHWFADFILAEHFLSPHRMISIERDRRVYSRACYNVPFAHIDLKLGATSSVLPRLLPTPLLRASRPVFWLDYEGPYSREVEDDIEVIVQGSTRSLALLVTFCAEPRRYGRARRRPDVLHDLFPKLEHPGRLPPEAVPSWLAKSVLASMKSSNRRSASGRAFVPAFRILYRDSVLMATVGAFLVSDATLEPSRLMRAASRCRPRRVLLAPLLTSREFLALRSRFPLPPGSPLPSVASLGFSLSRVDRATFAHYYLEYPSYSQVYL